MNIIVSMQKMNACIKLPNQSKYREMTAGMPTVRNGIAPSHCPTTPGMMENSAWFATTSAA